MNPQNDDQLRCEEISRRYLAFLEENTKELLEDDKWNSVFTVLDKLYIHPDYIIDDYRSKHSTNDVLQLYARHFSLERPTDEEFERYEDRSMGCIRTFDDDDNLICTEMPPTEIFYEMDSKNGDNHFPALIDPLQVTYLRGYNDDMRKDAIWQALMLHLTWRFIGQRWHGGYAKRTMIFSMKDIENHLKNNIMTLGMNPRNVIFDQKEIIPDISIDSSNSKYTVKFGWWDDWKGLSKVTIPFELNRYNTISFGLPQEEVLYHYSSSVFY